MVLYTTYIFEPLYNALIWLYNVTPGDIGWAIIVLTIILRAVMYPLFSKQIRSQRAMQEIQGEVKILQKKYKDDKQKLSQEMMKLYKDKKTNPLSSCLPLLVQLPIWFALYRAMRDGLSSRGFEHLYGFVANPGTIDAMFLGFLDLANPSIPLALLVGAVQYWQTKMLMSKRPSKDVRKKEGARDEDFSAIMSKQMTYVMPVMMVVIGIRLPAGLMLYILLTTVFLGLQQLYIMRQQKKEDEEGGDNAAKKTEQENPKEFTT